MVGAALLILQRRCRGRGGRPPPPPRAGPGAGGPPPPRPKGGPANEVRCDGGAIGPAAVSCALQGVKKKSSPRRDCCLAVFWCGAKISWGKC